MTTPRDGFFVVGPTVVLKGSHSKGADFMTLEAWRDEACAIVSCSVVNHVALIAVDHRSTVLTLDEMAEAIRLFVRVVVKRFIGRISALHIGSESLVPGLAEALRVDGFEFGPPGLVSTRLAFQRDGGSRAVDMDSVYRDPYSIPWSFVPVEVDCMASLMVSVPPGSSVLDLGCGFGKNAQFLRSEGYRVFGVDLAPSAIERARELEPRPEDFVVATATALPWPTDTFDAVLDVGCLHCMAEPDRLSAVRECARVLSHLGSLHSRIFSPRPASWLSVQPFEAAAFGMEPTEVALLFEQVFSSVSITVRGDATYTVARQALA